MQEQREPSQKKIPSEGVTPSMAQYFELKAANSESLLFYRMGDFYELFFADAEIASRALGIALTKRGKHLGEDIPMCGVPVRAADDYLQKLIMLGHKVAVCEQMEEPAEAKKRGAKALVRRDVVRLITPGTLTDDALLEGRRNNYLLTFFYHRGCGDMALAWADISSGELAVITTNKEQLSADLARLDGREIVVSEDLLSETELCQTLKKSDATLTPLSPGRFENRSATRRLCEHFSVATLDAFGQFNLAEISALGGLIEYILLTQIGNLPYLRTPRREHANEHLLIDPATRASLEIVKTLAGEKRGSLLATIDLTMTAPGSRLLAARLSNPSADLETIQGRLDEVGFFLNDGNLRTEMRKILTQMPDMERALSRLSLNRGGPRDLAAIGEGLRATHDLGKILECESLPRNLIEALQSIQKMPTRLFELLQAALADIVPLYARDGELVRSGYDKELDHLKTLRDDTRQIIAGLQGKYAEQTGVKSLKVRYNNILGYFIEVTAQNASALQEHADFNHRQTIANAMRFTSAELLELEQQIVTAADRALAREQDIYAELVKECLAQSRCLSDLSALIANIDVSTALGELAARHHYCRPVLDRSRNFHIVQGRHPVVEAMLEQGAAKFIANDCMLGQDAQFLWLLTGPNMAGKSTFLRQNALMVILAQIGSYVPAAQAHIGLVDRLFSRVGASDDLARGRSTFMMEMVETAAILNQARDRSFVIVDEIGRGTATFDGLSIAWACVEHLHEINKCRTLFATHYHELTSLSTKLDGLFNATVKVRDWQGSVVFLHEVIAGIADRSYGIAVAKLGGLPDRVITRAREVLEILEKSDHRIDHDLLLSDLPLFSAMRTAPQATASEDWSHLVQKLKAIAPDELTPREAHKLLYELRSLVLDI